jgi:hypothetical protein
LLRETKPSNFEQDTVVKLNKFIKMFYNSDKISDPMKKEIIRTFRPDKDTIKKIKEYAKQTDKNGYGFIVDMEKLMDGNIAEYQAPPLSPYIQATEQYKYNICCVYLPLAKRQKHESNRADVNPVSQRQIYQTLKTFLHTSQSVPLTIDQGAFAFPFLKYLHDYEKTIPGISPEKYLFLILESVYG